MNEQKLIEHFARDIIRAEVDDWPDKSNRTEIEIYAVAGRFAIEHTSIDTLPGHRDMDARFMTVIGDLEGEMSVSAHIMLAFEFYAIRTGESWSAIGDAIKAWIINSVPDLSVGRHHIADAPGVPFAMQVTNQSIFRPVCSSRAST